MLDARVAVAKRERDRALLLAYETGMFAALAWGGELKDFEHYRSSGDAATPAKADPQQVAAALHGAFLRLKSRGIKIKSERIDLKTRQPIGTA